MLPHDRARPASGAARASWEWAVLVALLASLGAGLVVWDRDGWPGFVGDEATYLMQAESLAFDGDLRYTRADFDRFVAHWGQPPEGLILQSGDGGGTITFGKPFFYALYAAPFVRLSPLRGPFVANFVLVVGVAIVVARGLRTTLGRAAPLAVAAWLFGSVAFAYTFWAHSDLFLMGLTALGLALLFTPVAPERRRVPRTVVAGLLLAAVAYSRPLYVSLALPALLAVPPETRRRGWPALLGGALALTLLAGAVHLSLAGSWTSYGSDRRGFYGYTGYPEVDFPAAEWGANIEHWGKNARAISLLEAPVEKKVVPSLFAWDAAYLLVGRHIGLLPYFLPLVLGFFGRPRGAARWALPIAVVLSLLGFVWLRGFNVYGGGGAIANRYFLPLYPAFWFVASRPFPRLAPIAAAVLAAPFMAPLWAAPAAFPLMPDRTYRFVSPAAERLLPYETTQSNLKPSGHEDVVHRGLWIKPLDAALVPAADGGALTLAPGARGRLLVGSPGPLAGVRVTGPVGLRVAGGATRPAGATETRQAVELRFAGPRAVHPMWWTWEPWYLYAVTLDAGEVRVGAGGAITLDPLAPASARP